MTTLATDGTRFGRPSKVDAVSVDRGCRYGGPSCLACSLPQCVEDMPTLEFAAFRVAWQARQEANAGA